MRGRGQVFQAVILWSVLVGCLTAGLLVGLQRRRARTAEAGPDDLGGVRELRAAPVPDVPDAPAAGARLTPPAEPMPAPVRYPAEPMPAPAPVPVVARSRMNNGSARFAGRAADRAGARGPAMPTRS